MNFDFPGSDYKFYNNSRIGFDPTDTSRQNLDSTQAANYMLSNFFENDKTSTTFALSQPNVFFTTPWNSNAVDVDSFLKNKTINSSEGGDDPIQRPFLTIPFIGRGSVDVNVESAMRTGESMTMKKSLKTVSETNYMDLTQFPLMEEWQRRNTVEEDKFSDGSRAGTNTRMF
jgi:hypothetical protein